MVSRLSSPGRADRSDQANFRAVGRDEGAAEAVSAEVSASCTVVTPPGSRGAAQLDMGGCFNFPLRIRIDPCQILKFNRHGQAKFQLRIGDPN